MSSLYNAVMKYIDLSFALIITKRFAQFELCMFLLIPTQT
jgi:hypothetical protein